MQNSNNATEILDPPHREYRRSRPSSVVPPEDTTKNAPRLNAFDRYSTTSSQRPVEAVVYPYQHTSPQSPSTVYNSYHATQKTAAAGSSGTFPYSFPTQPPQSYPRHPPSVTRTAQYPYMTETEKQQEHPLKKVNPSNTRYSLTVDTFSEGEEMTALMRNIHDVSYGAVDTRRSSDMSPAAESFAVKTPKARSRTNSEGLEIPSQRPPKRPGNSAGTSNHHQDVSPRHRRHNSDNSRNNNERTRSLTNYEGSPLRSISRTLSSSSLNNNTPAATSRHHRRRSSNSVFSSVGSIMTDASMTTLVADIEKSSLFAGYDEFTGQALFNLPISCVQISMEEHQDGMPSEFYQIREDNQTFENYHCLGDVPFGFDDHGQASDALPHALPPTRYIIHAPTDLYRRMVDEVSRSASLPCGLFFCGHHEDVAKPSLMIPIIVLGCFFGLMGVVAYTYRE